MHRTEPFPPTQLHSRRCALPGELRSQKRPAVGEIRSGCAILMLMAKENTSDRWDAPSGLPSDVQITVTGIPRAHPVGDRVASLAAGVRGRGRAVLAAAALVSIAIIVGAVLTNAGVRGGADSAPASYAGAAGLPAVYGYPSRGLSITISTANRAYARVDDDRSSECGRYCGYASAIFHRVGGSWRVVLDTVSYSCPVASLPPRVQADLAVCPLKVASAPGVAFDGPEPDAPGSRER
jgi:hypothetical protein